MSHSRKSRSLNPRAKEFVPSEKRRVQSDDRLGNHSDMIYIIRQGGKVESIRVEDRDCDKDRSSSYELNCLKPAESTQSESGKVYVNHFFGWTFNQISDFIRSAPQEICLDALYEAMRQRIHLNCIGVLVIYAVQKGEALENCQKRVMEAFHRFYKTDSEQEYDMHFWTVCRELNWVKTTL
jgi:hypothetical protein